MFASEKAALLGDVPTFIVAKALVTPRGGKADKTVDFQSQRNSLNGPRVSAASATRK